MTTNTTVMTSSGSPRTPSGCRPLWQIDCWTDREPGDCIISPDDQGDALTGQRSAEAFTSSFTARIFIEPGTDPATAARLLRKAAAWVERDPELLDVDPAPWF